jgi:CheY-like chemotaxis protein
MAGSSRAAKDGLTILIVDDNQDNRYAIDIMLKSKGYRVLYARNGEEGLLQARTDHPDLIFLDMMMPGMDGYEAAKKMRSIKSLKNIPIIAMTAQTMEEDKKRAVHAGCNEYLSKPFRMENLLEMAHKWTGGIS